MKEWTIEIYLLDEEGNEHPARCFNKVVYHLHPSFDNPVQSTSYPSHRPRLRIDCSPAKRKLTAIPTHPHSIP